MAYSSDSDNEAPRVSLVRETGLPHVTEEEKAKACTSGVAGVVQLTLGPRVLAAGIAYLIYRLDQARYDSRLAALSSVGTGLSGKPRFEPGYLFLAVATLSLLVSLLNMIPTIYKGKVLPGNAGNLRANMQIFKVNTVDRQLRQPYVVLEEDGEVGNYNRANRALTHFTENGISLGLNILLAGIVFSEPVLVLVVLYVVARIWYQVAYAEGGMGVGCCKHLLAFMLHTMIVAPILELLVWLAGARLLQHPTA